MRKGREVGHKYEFERYLSYDIEDLETFRILQNRVLIEYNDEEYSTTEGGILVVREFDFAAHSVRRGKVIKLPEKLTCIRNDALSMPWETELEIKVGDEVYLNHQAFYHCYPFTLKEKTLKLIDYSGIIFAKREDEIIMCNGYVMLEKQIETKKFREVEFKRENKNLGIVKAVGKPNGLRKDYDMKTKRETLILDSQIELKVGQKVFIHEPDKVFELEDYAHAKFDNRQIYNVCSRRRISAIL